MKGITQLLQSHGFVGHNAMAYDKFLPLTEVPQGLIDLIPERIILFPVAQKLLLVRGAIGQEIQEADILIKIQLGV
jgi:hypothetical protein